MNYHRFVNASLLWFVLIFGCLILPINSLLAKNGMCEEVSAIIFFGWPQNGMFLSDVAKAGFTSLEKCQFFVDRSLFSIILAIWLIIALLWRRADRYKVFIPSFLVIWSLGLGVSLALTLLSFDKNYNVYFLSQKDPLFLSIVKSFYLIFLFYYSLQMTLYMLASAVVKIGKALRRKNLRG